MTTKRVMRAGIVGTGSMARTHAAAVRASGHEVVGIAGSSPERAQRAAEQLRIARAYASFEELAVASDVDVVHVCTPNTLHADMAVRALAAGKDVVCEKPLAVSAASAQAIADATVAGSRRLAVPFVYRYHPMAREAAHRVRRGELGPVHSVSATYLQDWLLSSDNTDWRATADLGGPSRAFADIGSHACDFIEYVTGSRICEVSAVARTVFDVRRGDAVANEDLVSLQFVLASGGVGQVLVSQVAAGFKNALAVTIYGERHSLAFEQERPDMLWIGGREQNVILPRDPALLSVDAARLSPIPVGHPVGYQEAFAAFMTDAYDYFAGEAVTLLPTVHDGLRAAVLAEAVLASASHGTWQRVPDTTETTPTALRGAKHRTGSDPT